MSLTITRDKGFHFKRGGIHFCRIGKLFFCFAVCTRS